MSQQWWVVYDLPAQASLIAVQGTSKGGQVTASGKTYNVRSGPFSGEAAAENWIGAHSGAGASEGGADVSWYVVTYRKTVHDNFTVGVFQKPLPAYQTVLVDSGPWTKQEADQKAAQFKGALVPGAFGNKSASQLGLPNLSGLDKIGAFFASLTQANAWIRIGEVVLGVILLAVGFARVTGAGNAVSKAAQSIPKVVPV
jgi:hypothetical protein